MLNNIKPELVELNDMVGMKSLKETIFYQCILSSPAYIGAESDYKHTVIYGPPGTGKPKSPRL
jgi:Holliday junction resolvasome RuvABC ATP-dependent DNA helicase subunit